MKVAVRGGHNFQATGSSCIISETAEDRKVKDAVIKYLRQQGVQVLDVTPGNMCQRDDLHYGISRAKEWGAEMFFSIHFDNNYNSKRQGAMGTSVILKSSSSSMLDTAKRVNNHLADLGFRKHCGSGIVYNTELYELNHFYSSMIVEVCFVESETDVALYKKLGPDKIGKTIVEGFLNVKIGGGSSSSKPKSLDGHMGRVTTNSSNLLVRSQPSRSGNKLGSLPKGSLVKIFKDCGNGWYEIYFGAHGGFVSKDYITLV